MSFVPFRVLRVVKVKYRNYVTEWHEHDFYQCMTFGYS